MVGSEGAVGPQRPGTLTNLGKERGEGREGGRRQWEGRQGSRGEPGRKGSGEPREER